MKVFSVEYPVELSLCLDDFKQMDYYAVEHYDLPIELMMENAGLHLARLIASFASIDQSIKIGVGNGNNGGGGLVAARRLQAWGFNVHIDLFTEITKELPLQQLNRAIAFGAKTTEPIKVDIWVDAYLGFSQILPLNDTLKAIIEKANKSEALKISLDIPTGFLGDINTTYFHADKVLTLAAPKSILYQLNLNTELFVADLGIPLEVYAKFKSLKLDFHKSSIFKLKR